RDLLGFEPVINDIFRLKQGYTDRKVIIQREGIKISLMDTAIPVMDELGEITSIVNIFRPLGPKQISAEQCIRIDNGIRFDAIQGNSHAFTNMKNHAIQVAKSSDNVIIYGEPGTGKSWLAKALHGEGQNANLNMLTIDCTRLSVYEFENYFLNHKLLDRERYEWMINAEVLNEPKIGTLLFDGIDSLPISTQLHLFSALTTYRESFLNAQKNHHNVQARVIASVTDAMGIVIREQRLHPKLHGFLSEASLTIPPLDKRGEDLLLYVALFCAEASEGDIIFSERLLKFFLKQHWPGNLSQLKLVIRELLSGNLAHNSDRKMMRKVEDIMNLSAMPSHFSMQDFERLSINDAEKQAIYLALRAMDFNLSKAAQALGISRPTLYSKMKKYNLKQCAPH
ncbi:MAG: sigma 54-interacting transcriptional regulator, partial [Comamonas sp.]